MLIWRKCILIPYNNWLVEFTDPIYWYLILSLMYLNTAILLYYIARELKNLIPVDRKILAVLLAVPVLVALPMPAQHNANSFMHVSLAKAIAKNPFSTGHCIHFSDEGCSLTSFPAWSYAYHIILSLFTRIGGIGVQLMNSLFIGLFLAFTYMSIRKTGKTPLYLMAAVLPQLLIFLSTPVMEFAVLGFGAVFFYFLVEFFDGRDPVPLIASAMYFLHLRPESFVYVLLLMPLFIKPVLRNKHLFAFTAINLFAKYFEYQRGLFASEYGMFLLRRISLLFERLVPSVAYFFNPFNFNLVFLILLVVGIIESVRSKKYVLLLPPVFAFFAYATHFSVSFYNIPVGSKIIDIAMAGFPLLLLGLRRTDMPRYLLLLSLLPMVHVIGSEANPASELYTVSVSHKNEVAGLSNNLSMPVFTYFPYEFDGIAEAAFIMDDFPYGAGSYLVPQYDSYPEAQGLPCDTVHLTRIGPLDILNMTCGS